MKRHIAILLSIAALLLGGCVKEQFGPDTVLKDGEGWLFLNFGAKDAVQISTKATLGYASENQILNIYVFIFDSKGNKVFGNWLQSEDRLDSEDAVRASSLDKCWYVANTTSEGTPSRGCLKVKIPTGDNLTVYLITNLNADMVKISSDLLASSVNKEQDLKDFTMQLNQYTVSRNAYFPMSGSRSGIVVTGTAQDLNNDKSTVLKLKRLDSKINFKFVTGTRPDENGQVAKSFQALRWKVVNVPVTSRVIEDLYKDSYMASPTISTPEEYAEAAKYFFDTDWVNYERAETSKDMSFSFYMMENRQTPKNTSFKFYNDRSREVKTSAGLNSYVHVDYIDKRGRNVSKNIKQFVNANDFSTYVVVEGRVEMDLHDDDKGKVLGADVVYLIHLGDWNATIATAPGKYSNDVYTDVNNFAIQRNHSYNYTVTINSVNNIRVEVENETKITENQPGATGMVTIAKEEIAVCDAHYVSKTMTFHAKNFVKVGMDGSMTDVSNTLTWKVKTPFCDGSPRIENGIDIPEGLDYKWVHFRLNKKASDGSYYSDQRRKYTTRPFAYSEVYRDANDNKEDDGTPGLAGYHNDGVMDIIDLVKYIKEQAKLYVDYNNAGGVGNYTGDFDNGLVNGATDPEGPKICVTAFVDEYYYEEHPLTGVKSQTLWKSFVNKPDRTMHILSDSNVSKDLESSTTGSVVTIQQHSIQSFFDTDESETALHTAWGLEHMDEFPDLWQWGANSSAGNTDLFNGMLNTCKLWGLCEPSSTTFITEVPWSNYMNIEVNNDTPQLLADGTHNKLRYSCMTRNRDNNGDGKIDRDEVRWYAASIRQLIGIYVGEGVISPTSRLYNRSPEDRVDSDPKKWMQHVCSSTWQSGGEALVWAEEGISTGSYGANQEGARAEMSVRCVRNFGMDANHSLEDLPQDYVQKEQNPDNGATVYNLSFVNKASLRDYSSIELPLHLENEKENYLYEKFEVATEFVSGESLMFEGFNEAITTAISQGGSNPYCPKGYRTPNQREMAIMAYNKLYDGTEFNYYNGSSKGKMMSRTAFSFGYYGSKTVPTKFGYGYSSNITLDKAMQASTTRCVKDIRVD
ncbi:MAG: hypothetical protein PUK22_01570 [Bacteroides sp.]|nr:hypothetical protein [Bacteroides sp.]